MATSNILTKAFLIILLLCCAFAQDFEPDPLEPQTEFQPEFDTTTSTSQATTDSPMNPTETTTESTTTVATTTETTTSTSTSTSTSTEIPTNTPQGTSTTIRTTTKKPKPITTTSAPFYPSLPAQCYFKRQRGPLHSYWTCQGLQWTYPVECYYCCREENSMFAGCNRVDFSYCEWYN